MTTYGTYSPAQLDFQVLSLRQANDDEEIAALLGIPLARVERIIERQDAPQRPYTQLADIPREEPKQPRAKRQMALEPMSAARDRFSNRPAAYKQPAEHGTNAGNAEHRRNGEKPCEPCRAAKNQYETARRRAAVAARRETIGAFQ